MATFVTFMVDLESTVKHKFVIAEESHTVDISTGYESIHIVYDLEHSLFLEKIGPRILGTHLVKRLMEAGIETALHNPKLVGFVAVAGIATEKWATHEEGTDDLLLVASLSEEFKPLTIRTIKTKKNQPDPGLTPLFDDEMGRIWLRVFYNKSLDRIQKDVHSYVDSVTSFLKPLVSDPYPTPSPLDALFAAIPTNANYPEVSSQLLAITHDIRQRIAARLEPVLNAHIQTIPHDTLEGKKQIADFVNAEAERFGLAVECPNTGLPAKLKASTGHWAGIGRFHFEVYVNGKREKPSVSDTLPIVKLVDIGPDEMAESKWQKFVSSRPGGRGHS